MNIRLPERSHSNTGPLSPGTPAEQQTRSALSSKITSVLSASYADIEIRDALETLDARNIQNTSSTRRNLRRDVQHELIKANGEIVQDFGQVANQLRSVGEALHNLQNTVASIRQHVVAARTETKPLLDEAATLTSQRSHIETKQNLLTAFTAHFVLSPAEQRLLTSSNEPISDPFFAALVHAKRIHKDCSALLTGPSQRLGLEILDSTTKTLHAAFQRLYRYLSREFKSLDLENPRITASIRRALRVLAERPTLFQNCLDAFAEARERTLTEAFYAALTGQNRGQQESWQKPIDFSAHEPLRYVGDMLAWAHGTAVSEREALEGLFISEGDEITYGIAEGLESEPWSRPDESPQHVRTNSAASLPEDDKPPVNTFNPHTALSQIINSSLAGVAHLLTDRITTVIATHDDAVLAYKIANLVVFYRNIFARLVDRSGFIETLEKIEAAALDRFKACMKLTTAGLGDEIEAEPREVNAGGVAEEPDWLGTALEALSALLKSYETGMTSSFAHHDQAEASGTSAGLQLIYDNALEPYRELLSRAARTLPSDMDVAIFQLNNLEQIVPVLTAYPHLTKAKSAEIDAEMARYTRTAVEDTHRFLLETSGLAPLVSAAETENPAGHPAFTSDALASVSEQLDAFLPSAITDAEARLGGLRAKSRVGEIVREAGGLFVEDFEQVEEVVGVIEEGMRSRGMHQGEEFGEEEERLRAVFPRTAEEVRVLLS